MNKTVNDNGDTVKNKDRTTDGNTETHTAVKQKVVVKNQHTNEKCSIAEKRSTDF